VAYYTSQTFHFCSLCNFALCVLCYSSSFGSVCKRRYGHKFMKLYLCIFLALLGNVLDVVLHAWLSTSIFIIIVWSIQFCRNRVYDIFLLTLLSLYTEVFLYLLNFFISSCPLTWVLAPILEHRADYSVSLIISQAIGLLGRIISSSQGLYLNTEQHEHRKPRTHIKHPRSRRDLNPQWRPPSDRNLFKSQNARLPRPAR
jgi:dolichol kinase